MVAIPFPISHAPGIKPQEGAGRLINCYAEKTEQGARLPVVWRRVSGLSQVADVSSHTHFRGGIMVASTMVGAWDERAYSITKSGTVYTATNLGALAGSTPITVAKNNAGTPNIVCVTENGARNLFTGSAPTDFADTDLPQPNSVCELDGYFIFSIGDGRLFATDLNAVTVNSGSYTTEQGAAGRRVVSFRGEVFYFTDKWCGVYRNAATSPFPLERKLTIPRGICGTFAIAGWEPGWANDLIWVGEDSSVYRLDGYTPSPIGNPDLLRDIEDAGRAGDHDLLEAFVFMDGGHAMWALTYPGNWTWLFNKTTGNWIKRESYNDNDWRGSQSLRGFDEWLIGDRETGKLFAVDREYAREANNPMPMVLRSGCVANFPARLKVLRLDLDFTMGVGRAAGEDPIQTDPVVQIRWSWDGGGHFGDFVTRKLGKQGETAKRVTVNRIGTTTGKGIVVEVRLSDPVHAGFMGGQVAVEGLAA